MGVKFDKKGRPTMSFSKGKVVMYANAEENPSTKSYSTYKPKKFGKYSIVQWYEGDNAFPETVAEILQDTPVLTRAIETKTKATLGQGVFPCRVTEVLSNGEEVLEVISDPEVLTFFNSYLMRRYLAKTDYFITALGNAFVELVFNIEGTQLLRLNPVNSKHCRLSEPNANGEVEFVYVSGQFPRAAEKNITEHILLDESDPYGHLEQLKADNGIKGKSIFIHLKSDFSLNDFYPMPAWYAAKKWIDISRKVPEAILAGMDNMFGLLYHIQIPYEYWDEKYPENDFEGEEDLRRQKIEADIEAMETDFTSAENAKKALVTFFDKGMNDSGWKIDVKETKFSQENLINSSASDTQIAISTGIQPDSIGLMFGNSKGGSMQRELLLIQYALSWNDRQKLADPIEMAMRFNFGEKYADLEVRFRNTFLTKLDSGGETQTDLN